MKVCCVIVTFNRKDLLCRCIRKCLIQNLEPDVLVYDNASTDGTFEKLRDEGLLDNERVTYFKSEVNGGGAGGFSNGLRMAIEKGYDYVWLMDDDGYPRTECSLEACVDVCKANDDNAIVNAFVFAEDNKMSFLLGGCNTVEEVDLKFGTDEISNYLAPFNGTLIPAALPKKIGFPREDFFIKGDEFEYVTRAKSNGFKLITARKGEFYHPRFVVKKQRFLWKKIAVNDEPAWKEYCRARNHAYISRTYFGKAGLLRHYIISFIRCFYFISDPKKKRRAVLQGLIDEKNNIFSNEKVKEFW